MRGPGQLPVEREAKILDRAIHWYFLPFDSGSQAGWFRVQAEDDSLCFLDGYDEFPPFRVVDKCAGACVQLSFHLPFVGSRYVYAHIVGKKGFFYIGWQGVRQVIDEYQEEDWACYRSLGEAIVRSDGFARMITEPSLNEAVLQEGPQHSEHRSSDSGGPKLFEDPIVPRHTVSKAALRSKKIAAVCFLAWNPSTTWC